MFDPKALIEEHRELKFTGHKLSEAELRFYAIEVTKIREGFEAKSKLVGTCDINNNIGEEVESFG